MGSLKAMDYIDVGLKYIKRSHQSLEKITFKSERPKKQRIQRENATLRRWTDDKLKQFEHYQWDIKYQFVSDNTHTLTFNNNNKRIYKKLAVINKQKQIESIFPFKTDQIPSYFVQIRSVFHDKFVIQILAKTKSDNNRNLWIKEMNKRSDECIERKIKITKGYKRGRIEIYIDEKHDETYNLALYDNKFTNKPIPNSNCIQFVVLKNK